MHLITYRLLSRTDIRDSFQVIPITKENKKEQEENELDVLKNTYNVDLVILARYMQIISDTFCNTFPFQVINIHHSFLPAFIGGKPYHRAHARGVKVIGATVRIGSNRYYGKWNLCRNMGRAHFSLSADDASLFPLSTTSSVLFCRLTMQQPSLTKVPSSNRYDLSCTRRSHTERGFFFLVLFFGSPKSL
jgi:hypothetical protein